MRQNDPQAPASPPVSATPPPGGAATPIAEGASYPEGSPVTVSSPIATPGAGSIAVPLGPAGSPAAAVASPAASGVPELSDSAVAPPGAFPAEPMGFYTDTTVCIGCKACEVACKEWNGLSTWNGGANTLSGDSYDNTRRLDGQHWRHVKFIEQFDQDRTGGRWLMMSDVCKHCVHAGCLEVCPTGAIIRTEYDTVVIQSDVCNGCRDCIAACPFGVIEVNPVNNTAMKCTLCYDRMQNGLTPACAQACPTASIQFGPVAELRETAQARVQQLQDAGEERARLYGADDKIVGGLNSFYLLVDEPEVYGLPVDPKLPSDHAAPSAALSAAGAAAVGVLGTVAFRKRRMDGFAEEARAEGRVVGERRAGEHVVVERIVEEDPRA